MSAGNWFWIIYVVLFLFCGLLYWPFPPESHRPAGVTLIILVLVGLLGWVTFGPPLK